MSQYVPKTREQLEEYASRIPPQPYVIAGTNSRCPNCDGDWSSGVLISNPPKCPGCKKSIYSL